MRGLSVNTCRTPTRYHQPPVGGGCSPDSSRSNGEKSPAHHATVTDNVLESMQPYRWSTSLFARYVGVGPAQRLHEEKDVLTVAWQNAHAKKIWPSEERKPKEPPTTRRTLFLLLSADSQASLAPSPGVSVHGQVHAHPVWPPNQQHPSEPENRRFGQLAESVDRLVASSTPDTSHSG